MDPVLTSLLDCGAVAALLSKTVGLVIGDIADSMRDLRGAGFTPSVEYDCGSGETDGGMLLSSSYELQA
jgi:hypothetical protein